MSTKRLAVPPVDPGPLRTHPGILHTVLLEVPPDAIVSTAEEIKYSVESAREERKFTRTVASNAFEYPPTQFSTQRLQEFYLPRVYATWGTFDIAATYVAADWALPGQSDRLAPAGQIVQMAVLPHAPHKTAFPDFNQEFLSAYKQSVPRGTDTRMPADQRFVTIIKSKLSCSCIWPKNGDAVGAAVPTTLFRTALAIVWETIASWRNETSVGNERPIVALGLSFGWNELITVAHADSPGKLMRLVLSLRQPFLPIEADAPHGAHLIATTVSSIGYDFSLRQEARRELDNLSRELNEAGLKEIPVERLRKSAERLSGMEVPLPSNSPSGDIEHAYLVSGFSVYPGHERVLSDLLKKVRDDLEDNEWAYVPPLGAGRAETDVRSHSPRFEMGKQDIWGPLLALSKIGPTAACIYTSMLQQWARRSGSVQVSDDHGVLAYFDSYTRFGICDADPTDLPVDPVDDSHTRRVARNIFKIPELNERLNGAVASITDKLRILQLPYTQTDQVISIISAFRWAYSNDLLWDEAVELAPLVLCLCSHVECEANWRSALLTRAAQETTQNHAAIRALARKRLDRLHAEVTELARAFRNIFHTRHLTGYLADDIADVNLRYRGAVHQFLSIVGMVSDSIAQRLLGPRACIARVESKLSPEVQNACDVVSLEVSGHTLATPILLDSIAHEIGHQLISLLIHDAHGEAREHRWARLRPEGEGYRKLCEKFIPLDADVFFEETWADKVFAESTADFIEFHALRFEQVELWMQSFFLRATLSAAALDDVDEDPSRGTVGCDVPAPETDELFECLIRALLVAIAIDLSERDAKPEFLTWRRMMQEVLRDRVRKTIYEKCAVGPGTGLGRVLSDPNQWDALVWDVVWDTRDWLRGQSTLDLAWEFFRQLRAYVVELSPGAGRAVKLWESITEIMGDLRSATLQHAIPSAHLALWATAEDRKRLKEQAALNGGRLPSGEESKKTRPWRLTRQPISLVFEPDKAASDGSRPRSVIGQRGALIMVDDESEEALMRATTEYYARLLELVPTWRRSILETIRRVERGAGAIKGS